eukprot:scaffold3234_cov166-Amphora_coffeaeformis.AAC.16
MARKIQYRTAHRRLLSQDALPELFVDSTMYDAIHRTKNEGEVSAGFAELPVVVFSAFGNHEHDRVPYDDGGTRQLGSQRPRSRRRRGQSNIRLS